MGFYRGASHWGTGRLLQSWESGVAAYEWPYRGPPGVRRLGIFRHNHFPLGREIHGRMSLLPLWLPLVGESKVHAQRPHGLGSACDQRPAGGI